MMKRTCLRRNTLAIALTALAVAVGAWPDAAAGQATNTAAAVLPGEALAKTGDPVVDPAAIAALGNMGAYP